MIRKLNMKKDKLHTIKFTGFKTPEDYFESFDAKLQKRLAKNETIEGIKSHGYSIPKDYFETFDSRVLDQLIQTDDKPVIALKPRRRLYYITGIAASFALLFSLVFNQKNKLNINTIDTVSIETYLSQEEYSNDELASLFKTNEISETDFIDVNISEDTINEYFESADTEDFILD